ncbi:MAG: hypothetical protein ABI721_05150 [Candidatus Dojkabacteria bacterium]
MRKVKLSIKIIAILLILFLVPATKTHAQTSDTIEFKTSIIDQDQNALPDGTYNFRFALYNQPLGGIALWSEDWFGVQVRKAAISVPLGSAVAFPKNLFKNSSLYLQICLDANSSGGDGSNECAGSYEENFKPRKVITAVPWAFNAKSLGPVTIANGETGYNVDTYGDQGKLLNLNFNDNQRFTVSSNGDVNFGVGLTNFVFSPENNLLKLTESSDIYFGDNISLRGTTGAGLVGISTLGLQSITGNTLQAVVNNIDGLLKWRPNGNSIFYNGGNVGVGISAPAYPLDINGTGNFTNGIIIGDNTNITAGAIRFAASTFEGYDGVSWIPFAGAGSLPVTDNGAGLAYITNIANDFAVGGSSTSAPYYFNPDVGTGFATYLRPISVGDNTGFNPGTNLISLNATGTAAVSGGNYSSFRNNLAYTPTGGAGIEVVHGNEVNVTVNAGDGTGLSRIRGQRTVVTNNSSGVTDIVLGNSTQVNNNGVTTGNVNALFGNVTNTADYNLLFGVTAQASNSSAAYSGTGSVAGLNISAQNNGGGASGTLQGISALAQNDGTVDAQQYVFAGSLINNGTATTALTYGERLTTRNNGNTGEYGGGFFETYNNGDTNGQPANGVRNFIYNGDSAVATTPTLNGISNLTQNFALGNVTGDLRGISNTVANSGVVFGNIYGIISTDGTTTVMINSNSTYAIDTTGGPVRFSNEAVVGNSIGSETGSIRFNGTDFEGYNGSTWVPFGGGSSQWTDSGSNIYFVGGAVGIGASPSGSYALEVTGDAYISATSTLIGAVGIGTVPGVDMLTVNGTSNFGNDISITGTTTTTFLNVNSTSQFNGDVLVSNASLCVDGGTGCPALSPGGIYGDLAYQEFDVAENILAESNIEAGDLVSTKEGEREVVRKSNSANERNLLGIISTNPGSLGGFNLQPRNGFIVLPLVLSGRVPVKVSIENGSISAGDPITSSSIPGVGMKATSSKAKIVGYAMESYSGQLGQISKIVVIFQPGYLP